MVGSIASITLTPRQKEHSTLDLGPCPSPTVAAALPMG